MNTNVTKCTKKLSAIFISSTLFHPKPSISTESIVNITRFFMKAVCFCKANTAIQETHCTVNGGHHLHILYKLNPLKSVWKQFSVIFPDIRKKPARSVRLSRWVTVWLKLTTSKKQWWNYTDRENEVTGYKPVPTILCTPQIPHWLVCDRTRTIALRSRRLTALAMIRAKFHLHPQLSTTATEPTVMKIHQLDIYSFMKFHENPTKDIVADTKSQMDRRSPHTTILFSVRKSA